jgi:hypothetical protein
MSLTRTRSITTAALATVLIAGCGGSEPTAPPAVARPTAPSSATPSKPAASLAGLSAQQILTRTKAAAKAAVSVRLRGGTTADNGTPIKLDVRLARTASAGTISANGAGVKFLVIGRTAYLQFNDAFWRQNVKPKTSADQLMQLTRGMWIKGAVTDNGFSDMGMAFLASKTAFVSAMLDNSDGLRKIGTTTIGGIACIGLAGDYHTLWVDATNARPIRLDTPRPSGTASLTFSEYNQIKEPKAPPAAQVVDAKALGLDFDDPSQPTSA